MKRLKGAILQALAVVVIGAVVAFAHNAIDVNGINPFRKINDVPVVENRVPEEETNETEGIRFVTLGGFRELLEAGRTVIDARTAGEYEEGHVPGAVLLDYYEMGSYLQEVLSGLSMDEEIIFYCAGPECKDSELLARELYMMGFTKLLVFRGGWEEWEAAGLAVERGLM